MSLACNITNIVVTSNSPRPTALLGNSGGPPSHTAPRVVIHWPDNEMRSRDMAKFVLIFPIHSHEFSRRSQYPVNDFHVAVARFHSRADIGILQRMVRHEGEMKSWRSPFSLSVYKALWSKDEFCRNTNLTEQQCLLTMLTTLERAVSTTIFKERTDSTLSVGSSHVPALRTTLLGR
ncbi:hypothetical protein ARMSODRAFT_799109 [Armillaria solidipes]|uniref:Uncharacterized protein n=1 Tax=Armillaria solidipes TaxID=1076256 RepID=A0A2H3B4C2_9AGAR|nr:hypothetical protein ARMSODRAFT_799109 [Armillaria solidipes]